MRVKFVSLLVLSACASAPPMTPVAEVEATMWGYTRAWNKHDAATIARDFYRLGRSVEQQTAANEKTFADLVAQGYDKSIIHEVKGCMTGPDKAWAGMKFTRMKTDGKPLGPDVRASGYELTKLPEGWRITRMGAGGASPDQPLACPAS
jgi:hypothetical protein